MNCPQCQAPNQQESAFCANCGAQLAPAQAPAGGYGPPSGQGTSAGYGPPSGYGQGGAPGQYPPPAQQPPGGYQAGGQYQPQRANSVAPFQFDLNRLARVDRIVAGASFIVLISLFLPWFSASFQGVSDTASGTSVHGWLWLVFILDLVILAYFVMRAGWAESPVRIPFAHEVVLMAVTGLQLLLVLIGFFDLPGNDGISGVSIGWSWGAFVGLLAALVAAGPVLVPPIRARMESRR